MHYLVTGHTGFKGSWLSLMLQMQGHEVSGISLDPDKKSLFTQAKLASIFKKDLRANICNREHILKLIAKLNPDVIIHLAAQPLVRESYKYPIKTFETNVLGTLNILEATKNVSNLKATLIVTTDKVYKNHSQLIGYKETDELGGMDPYSASKAAADIATNSWAKSFAESPVAIARAGNVIGGGDWAIDRIIPDLVNAYSKNQVPTIRYPNAVRPWQHVFDCLSGYIALVDSQIHDGTEGAWNFGPMESSARTVRELALAFAKNWGWSDVAYKFEQDMAPSEANLLLLDSSKARNLLGWKDSLTFEESIEMTVDWYKVWERSSPSEFTRMQMENYLQKLKLD